MGLKGQDTGILGQAAPGATTETDLYTCPTGQYALCKVLVSERAGSTATFRVSVSAGGGATANTDYISYDEALAANESLTSAEFRVESGDVVRVYASTANVSFTCVGV